MSKDRVCLPFQFLVTSAQGHLKKANFSRKSSLHDQELHFLKKFEVLVSSSIPSHPLYSEKGGDKSVMEFEKQLEDVRKRIQELELDLACSSSKSPTSGAVSKLQKARSFKLDLPKKCVPISKLANTKASDSDSSDTSTSFFSKEEDLQKGVSRDSPLDSLSSEASLRSKLAESLKALSPSYSPRRLERSLRAAAKGSCLEQEASLAGRQWPDLKLDEDMESLGTEERFEDFDEDFERETEEIPAAALIKRQVRIRESVNDSEVDASRHANVSGPGPAMMGLYKQLLGAGSSGKQVEEFRQTLKALENLQIEKKEHLVEDYTRKKIEAYQQKQDRDKSFSGDSKLNKLEDVDFVKNFIGSGLSFLSAKAKTDAVSTAIPLGVRKDTKSIEKKAESKRELSEWLDSSQLSAGPVKSTDKGQNLKEECGSFREQIKAFKEGSKRKKASKTVMPLARMQLKEHTKKENEMRPPPVQPKHDNGGTREMNKLAESSTSALGPASEKTPGIFDAEMLRKEIESQLSSMIADAEIWKKQYSKQVEILVEERMDKLLPKRLNTLAAGTDKVLTEMKHDLARVFEEIQNVERARESLKKEQECLRHESGCMRLEVQNVREVGVQLKIEIESLRKGNEVKMDEFYQRLSKLRKEGADMKAQVEGVRSLEESMRLDRERMKIIVEMVEKDDTARKDELQTVRKEQEEVCSRIITEGEKEKAVIMDRIERLSQLYLIGLEDLRAEVLNLKGNPESSSTARAESLLVEMKNRRRKSMQLEIVMKNAVEAALKLQEKCSMELEKAKDNWDWAMNLQIGEAKAVLGDLVEQSQRVFAQRGGTFEGQNILLKRIQSLEDEVMQLVATVEPLSNDAGTDDNIAEQQEVIQQELHRLDEQVQDVMRKLEHAHSNLDEKKTASLRIEVDHLGEKLREATKSRSVLLDKITEMGKKIRKLDGAQLNLARSVEELRTNTSDLEKSASTWLPKYETATTLLQNMDARLGAAEGLIRELEHKANNEAKENGQSSNIYVTDLHTKVETLEGRVEHVASATFNNIRVLDSKVEQYRVGVQSAIDGAAMAETKCGVLGGEIVKVFRMLAARNGKLNEHNNRTYGPPTPGQKAELKEKALVSCKSCKKAHLDGTIQDEHNVYRKAAGQSRKVLSPEDYYDNRGQQAPDISTGNIDRKTKRNASATSFIESYAETFYESGRGNLSKSKTEHSISNEDEKGLAVSKPSKRKDNKTTDSRRCQRTNIRLEAGKLHVNVCHRVGGPSGSGVLIQP